MFLNRPCKLVVQSEVVPVPYPRECLLEVGLVVRISQKSRRLLDSAASPSTATEGVEGGGPEGWEGWTVPSGRYPPSSTPHPDGRGTGPLRTPPSRRRPDRRKWKSNLGRRWRPRHRRRYDPEGSPTRGRDLKVTTTTPSPTRGRGSDRRAQGRCPNALTRPGGVSRCGSSFRLHPQPPLSS